MEWEGHEGDEDAYLADLRATHVVGTPEQVLTRLEEFAAAGIQRVLVHLLVHTDLEAVELIGREVVPEAAAPLGQRMRRVLLTGMSAVGKSTIAERLSELGYKAVDTDDGGYSVVDERGDQHWDVDRIRMLLATEDADVLFVVGSDDAQVHFYGDFDHLVAERAARRHRRAARDPDQQPVRQDIGRAGEDPGGSRDVRAADPAGCDP